MGDIKEKYLSEAIAEYSKRIGRFADLKIIELKENNPKSASEKDMLLALEKDAQEIQTTLHPHHHGARWHRVVYRLCGSGVQ